MLVVHLRQYDEICKCKFVEKVSSPTKLLQHCVDCRCSWMIDPIKPYEWGLVKKQKDFKNWVYFA